jgi:hypothetical protein
MFATILAGVPMVVQVYVCLCVCVLACVRVRARLCLFQLITFCCADFDVLSFVHIFLYIVRV